MKEIVLGRKIRIFAKRLLDAAPARIKGEVSRGMTYVPAARICAAFAKPHRSSCGERLAVEHCRATKPGRNGSLAEELAAADFKRNAEARVFNRIPLHGIVRGDHLLGRKTVAPVASRIPVGAEKAEEPTPGEFCISLFQFLRRIHFAVANLVGVKALHRRKHRDLLFQRHPRDKVVKPRVNAQRRIHVRSSLKRRLPAKSRKRNRRREGGNNSHFRIIYLHSRPPPLFFSAIQTARQMSVGEVREEQALRRRYASRR